MAGLYDAITAARGVPTQSLYGQMQAARPVTPYDEAVLLDASNSPTLLRGLRMGLQGAKAGLTGYAAGALEAAGSPAAAEWYASANEASRDAALMGPRVQAWKDVNGLGDFADYALGQFGAAVPMLAPAVAGSGLAAAMRLSPGAAIAAGAAPMHPVLAGNAALRLHEDPVAAAAPAGDRFAAANLEGLGAGALLAATPGYMTARAFGVPGAKAAASLNPVRTAGGIAADTALSAGAQGAAGVAAGEVGRAVQRSFNPGYVPEGGVDEARAEEFASNALGALPMVAPLAVSGRVLGPAVEPGKNIAQVAGGMAKDAAGAALDATKAVAGKAVPGMAKSAGALAKEIEAAAREGRDHEVLNSLVAGEDLDTARIRGAGAGMEAAAGVVGERAGRAAKKSWVALSNAFDASSDHFQRALRERFGDKIVNEAEYGAAMREEQGKALQALNFWAERSGDDAALAMADQLSDKFEKGPLDSTDSAKLAEAAKIVQRKLEADEDPFTKPLPQAETGTGQASKGMDVFQSKARELLSARDDVPPELAAKLAGQMSAPLIERFGVTRRLREVLDKESLDPRFRKMIEERLTEPLRALKAERLPDAHEHGSEFLVDQFRAAVRPIVEDLYTARGADKPDVGAPVEHMVDYLMKAARGEEGKASVPRFVQAMTRTFGGAASHALHEMTSAARAIFGADSPQFKRLAQRVKDEQTDVSIAAEIRPALAKGVLEREGGRVQGRAGGDDTHTAAKIVGRMARDVEEASAEVTALSDRLTYARAAIRGLVERTRSNPQDVRAFERLTAARAELQRVEAARKGATIESLLAEKWKGLVKPDKIADAMAVVERFERAPSLRKAEPVKLNDTVASKVGEIEEDAETGARRAARGDDDETLAVKQENEAGTQDVREASQYLGQHTAMGGRGKPPAVDAPLDPHESPDFPSPRTGEKGGMFTHAKERAGYGERLVRTERPNVLRWAEERSLETGEDLFSLLNESMKALLAADKERLARVRRMPDSADTVKFIEARAELAKRVRGEQAGYQFFSDPMNRGFGYLKVSPDDASNLSYTVRKLERYSVGDGVRPDGYALTQHRRDPRWAKAVYEKSLMPVRLDDGSTLQLDIARLVDDELRRHQAADITGVGDKDAPTLAEDKRISPVQQHTPQEIHTALMNVLSTIMTTKGVKGEDAFGQMTGRRGSAFRTAFAGEHATQFLARDLVVLRDGVNGRAWTVGQLEGTPNVSLKTGRPEADVKTITPQDLKGMVKKSTGRSSMEHEGAAANGVLHRGLVKDGVEHDLDLRALLRHQIEKHGDDPVVVLHDSDVPVQYLKERLTEGLNELDFLGYKLTESAEAHKNLDNPQAKAMRRAVVYSREFGAKEPDMGYEALKREYAAQRYEAKTGQRPDMALMDALVRRSRFDPASASDTTLAKLREGIKARAQTGADSVGVTWGQLSQDLGTRPKLPPSLEAAKLAAKRDEVAQLEKTIRAWAKEREEGTLSTRRAVNEKADKDKLEKALKSLGFMERYFDPDTDMKPVGNKYRPDDTDNSRVAQILRELGDAPLFDKSVQRLFSEAAKVLEGDPTAEAEGIAFSERLAAAAGESAPGPATPLDATKSRAPSSTDLVETGVLPGKAPPSAPKAEAPAPKAAPLMLRDRRGDQWEWGAPKVEAPAPKVEAPAPEVEAPAPVTASSVLDRLATEKPGVGVAHKLLRALDDEVAREVALGLPTPNKRTLLHEQFANTLANDAERVSALGLKWNERGAFFSDTQGDAPFSKAKARSAAPDKPEDVVAAIHADVRSMLGDLVKVETSAKTIPTADGEAVGKYEAGKIVVSLMAEDVRGATSHETWHAVRDLLGTMGDAGKRVLDTISRAVDQPYVREWLETTYADDAGALKQIGESTLEREAFAFQAFRDGKTMPIAPEARGLLRRFADWVNGLLKKVGLDFSSNAERANNFFKHVSDGAFLRDHENPASIVRALGETKSDNFKQAVSKAAVPLTEAVDVVIGHTAERIDKMGVKPYTEVRRMFEGENGKGGYTLARRTALQKFDNDFNNAFGHLKTDDERRAFLASKAGSAAQDAFLNRLRIWAGMDAKRFASLTENVFTVDAQAASDRFSEFLTDVMNHGGVGKEGVRDIAARFADEGYVSGVKLFADSPDLRAKWTSKNPFDGIGRIVETVVNHVERDKAFGPNDEKLKAALAEGDKQATAEQRNFMKKAMLAYEHKLGHDQISPGLKTAMSVMIVANNIRLLPLAVFSQFLEPMQIAFRKNDMNAVFGTLFEGIKQLPRSFEKIDKGWTKSGWEKLAEQIGTAAPIGSMLSDMHTGFHMGGKTGKLNDLFFRYTGQEAWNRAMTIEATKHAVEFLRDHAGLNPDYSPGEHSARFLKEVGLAKDDVKFNSKGEIVLDDKVEKAIVQFVQEAMSYPDAGSNPLWMNDARFALLAQMKRFMFAHNRYVLQRGEREFAAGNKWVLLPYVSAVPMMLVSDTLRDMVSPSDQSYKNSWTYTDHVVNAMERSGMFGRGQLVNDALSSIKHGGTGVEGALGPTYELFGRIARGANNGHMIDALIGGVPGGAMIRPD